MVTEQQVIEALKRVEDPELHRDVLSLGMIKDVKVAGDTVSLTLVLTTPACPVREKFESDVREAVARIPGVSKVQLNTEASVKATRPFEQQGMPGVRNVIAVASGKGGVGKTTVAVNIAVALAQEGAKVGLMDADIYGPNVPLMMGLTGLPPLKEGKIVPAVNFGVKVVSMGFLIKPDEAVIWRGPMLHGAINKFLKEVIWGELDYLIVDLPPGCLAADTLIPTQRGPVRISEIREGDRVYSFDGNVRKVSKAWRLEANLVPRRVSDVFPQGQAEVFELRTPTRTICATGNHPILALRRFPSRSWKGKHLYGLKWMHLAELRQKDWVVVVKKLPQPAAGPLRLPRGEFKGELPNGLPTHSSEEWMRLAGYFLGDGTLRRDQKGSYGGVWFSEPEMGQYRQRYIHLVKHDSCKFHAPAHILWHKAGFRPKMWGYGAVVGQLCMTRVVKQVFGLRHIHERPEKFAALSGEVAELFDLLGLGRKVLEKRIPEWMFAQPQAHKIALIEGFCDADGHRRKVTPGHRRDGWMCFESPNAGLMEGLRALCMDVGYKVSNLNSRTRSPILPSTGRRVCRTFWNFEANAKTKTSVYGAGLIRGREKGTGHGLVNEFVGFERVREIRRVGKKVVYDLQVEGEHNFVAEGLIVHNTGDVQLSLCQSIPLTGALIVTTPQDVALLDVRRAISMFEKVKVPILGVVENMSTFLCPHCGKPTDIFDKGGGARAAEALKIPFLGEVPLIPEVRVGSDTGHPIVLTHPHQPAAQALTEAAKKLAAQVSILAAKEQERVKSVWKV